MISGFGLFCICSAILVLFSLLFPHRHSEESSALVWKNLLEPLQGKAWSGIGNFRVLALLLFLVMAGLYWGFAGSDSYYGVDCSVLLDGKPSRGVRLVFECDEPVYNFSVEANQCGRFVFPSGAKAGGAPAGTTFRVKTEPVAQVVKVDKDGKVLAVISTEPPGTKIDVREKDGKTIILTIDKKTIFDGKLAAGQKIELLPSAKLEAKYANFETSGLCTTIEADNNVIEFKMGK